MSSFAQVNTAPVKWAQRVDSVYVTICLADVTEPVVEVKENTIKFSGLSGGKSYSVDLELVIFFICFIFITFNSTIYF